MDMFLNIPRETVEPGMPEVSVIVLTYNQEGTIARAINSILQQETNFKYEIIIGEDGSTDGTRRICEEYAERYPDIITLLPKAPNKGVVKNYFDAFRATRGIYIGDCAGDDRWSDPHKMQTQRNFMNQNTDVSIFFTAWTNVVDGKPVDYGYPPREYWDGLTDGRQMLESFLAHQLPIVLSTALYRRRHLAKELEKNPEWIENEEFGCEDLPVCAALLNSGLGASSTKRTFEYTIGNPDSITATGGDKRTFEFHLRALKATVRLANHYNVTIERIEPHVRTQIRYLLSIARDLHDRELVRRVRELVKEYKLPHDWKCKVYMAIYS